MARCNGEKVDLVVAAVLVLVGPLSAWAVDLPGGTRPSPASRIQLSAAGDNMQMRNVVERASRRFRKPECRRLFSEFTDELGQPLQARLDALGLTGETYLSIVVFRDGSSSPRCTHDKVLAFTSPGSRVVRVCSGAFFGTWNYDHIRMEAIVIHEALHTLGLGENPPSSAEITARVLQRCQWCSQRQVQLARRMRF